MDDLALILREHPTDGVRLIRLNRSEKRNAISTPMLRAIVAELDDAKADPSVRSVVITGDDRVFAAGADIGEMSDKDVPAALRDVRPALWQAVRSFPKPLLAAVEGWCLGAGNELLMCCDIAVAGEGAKFGQPETNLAIIPGAGGTATLPRLVGRARAMRMVLLGESIGAREAFAAGLISEVVPDGAALCVAVELAARIASRAPLAMCQAKAMVSLAFDIPHAAHLLAERQAFATLHSTEDKTEGVSAFTEKRKPTWRGR